MKILNRWNMSIIFECEKETIKETVNEANLREADLREADLFGADLREANLREADLREADLRGADLREADLFGADLRGADLFGADLFGADLLQMNLPFYQVVVQKTHTRIGCEYHTNEEWKSFDDHKIKSMDSNALEFWNKFKTLIFSAIDSLNKEEQ